MILLLLLNFFIFSYSLTIEDCFINEIYTSSTCTPCPAGKEPNSNKTECIDCPGGYYSTELSACLPCMPGTHSNKGAKRCSQCGSGQYSSEYAQEDCLTCEKPFISDEYHSRCKLCPNTTFYVGYKDRILPCKYCGRNQISINNNTDCFQCRDIEKVINNQCVPICNDTFTENCEKNVCRNDQYLKFGECENCPVGSSCKNNIKTDCEFLDNKYCKDNEIYSCITFIQQPNSSFDGCVVSSLFISICVIVSGVILAVILAIISFIVTRFVVQKKVIDFSQNNAQETDPTKVYLLSF